MENVGYVIWTVVLGLVVVNVAPFVILLGTLLLAYMVVVLVDNKKKK